MSQKYDEVMEMSEKKLVADVSRAISETLIEDIEKGKLEFTPEAIKEAATKYVNWEHERIGIKPEGFYAILKRHFSSPSVD